LGRLKVSSKQICGIFAWHPILVPVPSPQHVNL
jgi:hypothetical protein